MTAVLIIIGAGVLLGTLALMAMYIDAPAVPCAEEEDR